MDPPPGMTPPPFPLTPASDAFVVRFIGTAVAVLAITSLLLARTFQRPRAGLAVAAYGTAALLAVLPRWLDATTNSLALLPPLATPLPAAAVALHARALVADAHADLLLWGTRSILGTDGMPFRTADGKSPVGLVSAAAIVWQSYVAPYLPPGLPYLTAPVGQTDVARLRAGGVGLATLAVVTTAPWRMNTQANDDPVRWGADRVGVKAALELWPPWEAASRLGRVRNQARRLHEAVLSSRGRVVHLRSRGDLETHVAAWKAGRAGGAAAPATAGPPNGSVPTLGVVLAVEGVQCLVGQLANLDVLYAIGVRVLGLAHFHDTEAGGSSAGRAKGGLTPWGWALLRRAKEAGFIIDLAHASAATIADVLGLPDDERPPVMVSHTGLDAQCPSPRNVDDATVRAVVAAGGVIGVTFFDAGGCVARGGHPVGSPTEGPALFDAVVAGIVHAVTVAGPSGVMLGSDWDGAVRVSIGPGELVRLTAALLDAGLDEGDVEGVLGRNYVDFLGRSLPNGWRRKRVQK